MVFHFMASGLLPALWLRALLVLKLVTRVSDILIASYWFCPDCTELIAFTAVYALVYAPSTSTTPTPTLADIAGTDHGWANPATASAATGVLLSFIGCVFGRR